LLRLPFCCYGCYDFVRCFALPRYVYRVLLLPVTDVARYTRGYAPPRVCFTYLYVVFTTLPFNRLRSDCCLRYIAITCVGCLPLILIHVDVYRCVLPTLRCTLPLRYTTPRTRLRIRYHRLRCHVDPLPGACLITTLLTHDLHLLRVGCLHVDTFVAVRYLTRDCYTFS